MNEVYSICASGVSTELELFTIAEEELRQYVVYVYYNIGEEPLFVGCSKSFYNTHYFNSERLHFFNEVEYVGFVFFENETHMKDARKYYVRALNPKYNKRKCKDVPFLPDLEEKSRWLVVSRRQMEFLWGTLLCKEEEELEEGSEQARINAMAKQLRSREDPDGFFDDVASTLLALFDRCKAAEAREDLLFDESSGRGLDFSENSV